MTVTHNMKRQSIKYGWEWPKSRKDFEYLSSIDYSGITLNLGVKKQADGKYLNCNAKIAVARDDHIRYGQKDDADFFTYIDIDVDIFGLSKIRV